jgi:AcrR family transcriptional regulator
MSDVEWPEREALSSVPPDTELPRGIALAWGVAASPQRGPKREMSVERIVDAAVEIADAEGLAAVSMNAVATRLGFTPMSLYRYVSAKDDLVLLMQEQATGVPAESLSEAGGWRARLEALYGAMVETSVAHPWMLELPVTGVPTPNASAWLDALVAATAETALSAHERVAAAFALTGASRWEAAVTSAGLTGDRGATAGRGGQESLFRALIGPDGFPALHAAVAAGGLDREGDAFHLGLGWILDGLARHIEARAAGAPPRPPRPAPAQESPAVLADRRYKEAQRAVREAERALRAARKVERGVLKEARERAAKHPTA